MYSGGNNTDVSLPAHSGLKSTDPIWRLIRLEPFKTHTHTHVRSKKRLILHACQWESFLAWPNSAAGGGLDSGPERYGF